MSQEYNGMPLKKPRFSLLQNVFFLTMDGYYDCTVRGIWFFAKTNEYKYDLSGHNFEKEQVEEYRIIEAVDSQ